MRVIVIGGSGHIGTYLSPALAEAGHEVVCVSRGQRSPYCHHPTWDQIDRVTLDRAAEEATGDFGRRIADLQGDVVIDLTCYTPASAKQMVDALQGRVGHFLHCGTIWVHGHSVQVPTTEDAPRRPFGDYGCRKAAIEAYLLEQAAAGFPVTILHPGHLVGPGWRPINPAGNFNPDVFSALATGAEVLMPNLGMETLHHVHAADVAQCFVKTVSNREAAIGESFHVVSGAALTLRGYAESMAQWFGCEANLSWAGWDEWRHTVTEREAAITWDHIAHSPNCSIEKARTRLDYAPGYSSLGAVQESVTWLIQEGSVKIGSARAS